MMDEEPNRAPRISIKLGASLEFSTTKPKRTAAGGHNGRRHRAYAKPLEDDEVSSDASEYGRGNTYGRQETVTEYGPGAAQRSHKVQDSKSRDGRPRDGNSRTRSCDSTYITGKTPENTEGLESLAEGPIKYGLTLTSQPRRAQESSVNRRNTRAPSCSRSPKSGSHHKTADEAALDALLGNNDTSHIHKKRKVDNDDLNRDTEASDYRALPIEDFGATLLRGMGWDGKLRGAVRHAGSDRRPGNLAGLGAKNVKEAEELGAWDQSRNKDKEGGSSGHVMRRDERPPRLSDYRKKEESKRRRVEDRYGDRSYKREREKERDGERERDRAGERDR